MLALLSIDEINRLIHFPSIFKSIDKRIFFNLMALFPFFNIISILNSLKYQSDLIDDEQEYYPPSLCNDGLYTWYRMGQIAKKQRAEALDEQLNVESQEAIPETIKPEISERAVNIIDINTKERAKLQTEIQSDNGSPQLEVEQVSVPAEIIFREPVRVISKSTFKKVSIHSAVREHVKAVPEVEEELSGFAKWLSKTSATKAAPAVEKIDVLLPEVKEVVEEIQEVEFRASKEIPVSDEVVSSASHDEQTIDEELSSEEAKKKKKKEKKHKKKDLVNQLVYQSVIDNDLLISEPFAEILYAQGYKEKAIKIYEKLMVKFPEKKINFAAKIDKINKENI